MSVRGLPVLLTLFLLLRFSSVSGVRAEGREKKKTKIQKNLLKVFLNENLKWNQNQSLLKRRQTNETKGEDVPSVWKDGHLPLYYVDKRLTKVESEKKKCLVGLLHFQVFQKLNLRVSYETDDEGLTNDRV